MTDDVDLSRRLTAAIRAADGVTGVYPAQPVLEAAMGAVAARLALRVPDVLVDIDRDDGSTTVSAHIATSSSAPAVDVVRRVGELILAVLSAEDGVPDGLTVEVRVRLVEDTPTGGRPSAARGPFGTERRP
jgi:hypothetical protein